MESEWIEKIAKGDHVAFERLFTYYCQPLINFACRYVKNTDIAENIVQDIFVKIWQNRTQLDPSSDIKIYLYTAVKNQSYKYFRHLDVKRRATENLPFVQQSVKTPEDERNEKEIITAINKAIEKLPKKARIIFSMNRFDNLTYKEIAKIQNISVKTVETHMGRALKFLRDHLSHLLVNILL